jgi:NAD(P)H dehydrogenase (quinone)
MKIHSVYAHPEISSVTRQLAATTTGHLGNLGHTVQVSDLYGMKWKAAFDDADFLDRVDPQRLNYISESGHAYVSGTQTADVTEEQRKLLEADALVLHFPLWWFGMPAILKGWFDRIFAYGFAYGYRDAGNRYRYGEGGLAGKRALICVSVGGPSVDYGPRGINGPLDQLLFPLTHGTLFFAGMTVLPIFAVYGTVQADPDALATAQEEWRSRLSCLFDERPIPFRSQNAGDYPDGHVLAEHVAPDLSGIVAHISRNSNC